MPMQGSLMERQRQRDALMRESEILRALSDDPALSTRFSDWLAAAQGRLAAMARPRARLTAADCRVEPGSSAVA